MILHGRRDHRHLNPGCMQTARPPMGVTGPFALGFQLS